MSQSRTFGFETRAIHAGAAPDPATGARATPIYQTTSFVFDDADHAATLFNLQQAGFIYSRLTNPTVSVLEERLASLEGGRGAIATSSGHAAQLVALFPLMRPGDEIVAARQLYGGSLNQMGNAFARAFGWVTRFVDATKPESLRAAVTDKTQAVFVESLANPGGVVIDLRAIADIADAAGVPLIVDNTLATPWLCRPIEHGATLVVHSTTKFLSGNGTSIGGVVVDSGRFDWSRGGRFPALAEPEPGYHGLRFHETFGDLAFSVYGHAVGLRDLGPSQAPLNAFLTLAGIETLPLRMERHCANALALAAWLETRRGVRHVRYPFLSSHPQHDLARRQMRAGSGLVTFELEASVEATLAFCRRLRCFTLAESLGGVESLVCHPPSMTHASVPPDVRRRVGIADGLVRLSVGIEDVDDLRADLEAALSEVLG